MSYVLPLGKVAKTVDFKNPTPTAVSPEPGGTHPVASHTN